MSYELSMTCRFLRLSKLHPVLRPSNCGSFLCVGRPKLGSVFVTMIRYFLQDALDVSPKNNRLSQEECRKLCNQILQEEGNDDLVDMVFQQMDRDKTGDVSWENFLNFFNVDDNKSTPGDRVNADSVEGFRRVYGLLAEIPLFEGVTISEWDELTRVLQKVWIYEGCFALLS